MPYFIFEKSVALASCPPSEKGQRIIDAIESIKRGEEPSAETLANAPLLTNFEFVGLGVGWFLFGKVIGHPRLANGPIFTSVLCAVDTGALAWVRTRGRYYRLGKPLERHKFNLPFLNGFSVAEGAGNDE